MWPFTPKYPKSDTPGAANSKEKRVPRRVAETLRLNEVDATRRRIQRTQQDLATARRRRTTPDDLRADDAAAWALAQELVPEVPRRRRWF